MSDNARFNSVSEMLRETSEDADLVADVERFISGRKLVKHLIAHRVKNDMSQQDVAQMFGCTQSRISKLESSSDDDVRLGDIKAYAQAIGLQLRLVLGPQDQTVVDEVKYHACRIKHLLQALVSLADDDAASAEGISKFVCIETPTNLLKIVIDTAKHIPQQVVERLPRFVIEDECLACEQEEHENIDSDTEIATS